jgi:citrate synthase
MLIAQSTWWIRHCTEPRFCGLATKSSVDQCLAMAREADGEWLTAARASALLDVKRATLYAYVSRGLVRSRAVAGSRARLYQRDDLLGLKTRHDARSGHAPVAASALRWGEPVLDSSITEIRDDGPAYRGHPVASLVADRVSFEQAAELLWSCALPKAVGWQSAGLLLPAQELSRLVSQKARPLDAMLLTLTALSSQLLLEPVLGSRARWALARSLILELAASAALPHGLARYRQARREARVARRLLVALGGKPSVRAVALMDLCTISGAEHGGTTERISALVAEVGAPERAARVIAERMRRGDAVVGFGHRLYREGDPRVRPMLEGARALGRPGPSLRTLLAIVDAIALAAAEPPSLDVGLVAVASALGLSPGAPLAIFALGRLAGFVAHADEQRTQGVMLRPRARYVRPT